MTKRYTSKSDLATLRLRQGGMCAKCGNPLTIFAVDHIQALARGGDDTLENKQLLCLPCHTAKTHHPRSLATTLGGDNFEAKKTARMENGGKTRRGPKIKSRGFAPGKRKIPSRPFSLSR